jgi:oligopeptide transport system substrate-binding protein
MRPHRLILSFLALLVLVGCGKSGSDDTAQTTTDRPHARPGVVVLNVGNGAEPDTLDPQKSTGKWESNIIGDMIIGLTTEDAAGKTIPGAATSWETSADGLTWTFHLRKNMNWSDGVPVTADDFVFALRRILDPKTAAQYASLLYVIKNAEAVNDGKLPPSAVGAKAIDAKTLQITLEHPVPYFLALARHQTMAPVPKHVVEKYGDDWVKPAHIVVNGPYTLAEWIPNSYIKLVKNQQFYDAKDVQIDEVYYYPISDQATELKRYQTGELDITSSIPARQLPWAKKTFGDQVHVHPIMAVGYEQINTQRPPFNDVRVRRALSMAIDRSIICYKILNAGQTPAYSLVPPDMANYPDGPQLSFKDESFKDRQNEARKLLAEAGFGPNHPLHFTYRYMDSLDGRRVAVAMQDMWKQVGVNVELLNSEPKVHYDALRTQNFEVAAAGWVADYDDPQNFLYLLETSTGAMNYARYSNPEFDKLMKEAAVTLDLTARAKILAQAEEIILKDSPIIPLDFGASRNLVAPYVKGWVDNLGDWHRTRFLSIEKDKTTAN